MDKQESQRLQQEIQYWSNVISSHKRSNNFFPQSPSKKTKTDQRYAWNKFKTEKDSEENMVSRNISFQNLKVNTSSNFHASKSFSSSASLSKLPSFPTKASSKSFAPEKKKYTWNKAAGVKHNNSSAAHSLFLVSKSHSMPILPVLKDKSYSWKSSNLAEKNASSTFSNKTIAPPTTYPSTTVLKPFSQVTYVNKNGTSIAQHHKPKLASKSPAKSLQKVQKDVSRFKWNNSSKSHSPSTSALARPSATKKFTPSRVARSNSKYRYTRRRSSSLDRSLRTNSASKSVDMRKKILAKYKLLLTRQIRSSNLSKNPYKVIKQSSSSSAQKTSRSYLYKKRRPAGYSSTQKYSPKKYIFTKRHKFKTKRRSYKSKFYENHNRFKFIRQRVATRSKSSGNIVLKRKQQTVKGIATRAVKTRSTPNFKRRLASNALFRSLETARSKNRHKLKKVYCIFYNRFGKCNRGDKCTYVHDPERIAICPQYLRGTCRNQSCPFSHKTSKQKMPVCSFFLRGSCSAVNCPYLHVFLGKDAPICKTFAFTGFCAKAEECKNLHIRACPDFYEKGKCEGKCNLPHRKKIRKNPARAMVTSTEEGFISLNTKAAPPEAKNDSPKEPPVAALVRIQPRLKVRKMQK